MFIDIIPLQKNTARLTRATEASTSRTSRPGKAMPISSRCHAVSLGARAGTPSSKPACSRASSDGKASMTKWP